MASKGKGNPTIRNVGVNVKFLSAAQGFTPEDMASRMCCSRGTFYNRLKEPGSFTLLELVAIAKALGTTPERLMAEP